MPKRSNQRIVGISGKTGKTMNRIELAIFGAMAIYIIVVVVMYFQSEPVRGYEIQMGSLSVSKTYTGIAIREESTFATPYTGYINYYVREGERVSTRDTVYSIDESGKLASLLSNGELGENSYTDDDLNEFRSSIIQYDRIYNDKEFQNVYDFKYELAGSVMELVNASMYESLKTMNQTDIAGTVNLCSTGKTGYVVYSTDGYEELSPDMITAEMYDQTTYEKKRVNNNDLVESNALVGKLITSENWSLVIPVDEERAVELEEAEYVRIKFIRTQETSWASVTIQRNADGVYAVLSFTNSCTTFCTDRFVEIELATDEQRGLKIPNSSIAEKEFFIIPAEYMTQGGEKGNYGVLKQLFDENGNETYEFVETTVYNSDDTQFYVDNINISVGNYIRKPESTETMAISQSGTLIGVYNMNKGYADFKQITILYQNDEYSIVSSNTKYGLTVYDRIVLDAKSVDTDQFIY